MFKMLKLMPALALIFISGCAASGQTTLLGLGVGSLVGGAVGAAMDGGPRDRLRPQNIYLGSAIGGILAATTAFLFHPDPEKKTEMADIAAKTNELMRPKKAVPEATEQPLLVPPKVETRYIDDQVKGSTFVPGHLEFQITQPSQWSRE
jgi:hypothetical protein